MGPYDSSPFHDSVISPLGLQPKKTPGEFRVIHDLSYPNGKSINSGIPRDFATVKYSSISDAIKLILYYGEGAYLAKTDIKSAFRIIPIHPNDYHLLGFKWKGKYFFDKCLPMGASSSCYIFERFSTSLHWIFSQFLTKVRVVHVLDDFLFVGANKRDVSFALSVFLDMCVNIGVPIAHEKTMGPAQILPFLGIQLNTVDMSASLPVDKISKILYMIHEFLHQKSVTLKRMQSMCGLLNFASGVIVPARAFTRRLYDLCIGVPQPYYKIKLTKAVKQDLRVWLQFLLNHNRKTFLLDFYWISNPKLDLYTDSASTIGYGAVFGSKWLQGLWHPECLRLNIALLELYPICVAMHIWASELKNKCITLHSDNQAVVAIINSNTSKDPMIMILVRKLVLTCMSNNIFVRAHFIPGTSNTIPDLLSRNQVDKARALAPHLDQQPIKVPPEWELHKWLKE